MPAHLRREGWTVNVKRDTALSARGLEFTRKGAEATPQLRSATSPSRGNAGQSRVEHGFHARSLDGRTTRAIRLLTIVDIFTLECLALEVALGFRARDVVGVLTRLVGQRGAPVAIRCDQGTEFTAEALDQWAYNNRIELSHAREKPTDNAFAEAFNASVRKELLNTSWFDTLETARRAARAWRRDYNEVRPHRSLANETPNAFALAAKKAS